jgi:hypothetical protein
MFAALTRPGGEVGGLVKRFLKIGVGRAFDPNRLAALEAVAMDLLRLRPAHERNDSTDSQGEPCPS